MIGANNSVKQLNLEVKNDKNEWICIQAGFLDWCGTGKRETFLRGNEISVAKIFRYDGDISTQCRLKFVDWGKQPIYSNIFINKVSGWQLDHPIPEKEPTEPLIEE
jgi:hypothetical protein